MIVALYGVALAMIVGGLMAIVQGYGIIVLERGWTLVIAGSVCASSGAVLLGITYAASRLAGLQGEIGRLRDRMARPEPAFPPPPPGLAAPAASEGLLTGGATVASLLGAAERAESGARAEEERTPIDLAAASTLKGPDARIDEATNPAEPAVPETEPQSDFAKLIDADIEPDAKEVPSRLEAEASEADRPGPIAPEAPVTDKPAPEDEDLFERAALKPSLDEDLFVPERTGLDTGFTAESETARSETARSETPESETARSEIEVEPDREVTPSVPVADRDLATPTAETAPSAPGTDAGEASSEDVGVSDQPLAVVGTYTSGGTRYVMFSDGSIEAETPNGTFQFGSLEELKAFIASGEGEAR